MQKNARPGRKYQNTGCKAPNGNTLLEKHCSFMKIREATQTVIFPKQT